MFRKSLIIVLLVWAWQGAGAQTAFRSLEDVWKYADEHNINIRNSGYELDKAKYAKTQSYMAFLPTAGVNGSFTNNTSLQTTLIPAVMFGGPEGVYKPVQFGQKYIYSAGLSAQLDIVNVQTWFNLRIAKETEEMNKASLSNTRKNTYQQIATQYYTCILNREAARLSQQSERVADSIEQSVANKYAQGSVSMANLDVARINKERASQTSTTAQYQEKIAINNLKVLLNLSTKDSLIIETALQAPESTGARPAFTDDPTVRMADFQTRVNLANLKSAKASYLPTISVAYSYTTQQNDNKYEPFQGGPQWYNANFWTLKANWNILNGGSRWLQVQRSKMNLHESELQLDNAQKQSAINDENLWLNYSKASILVKKAENIMNLSMDNYRHITNKYEAGLASMDDRLTAFNDFITYQNQYLNTLSDMLVQQYQVKIRQKNFN